MTRMRVLSASLLLLIAIPLWRWMDMISFIWPSPTLYALSFSALIGLFVFVPIKLLKPKLPIWWVLLIPLFGLASWYVSPLSPMSTQDPNHNHCGGSNYTGFFYPVRGFLTATYQDDLEIRNQFCWMRKIIIRIPVAFAQPIEYQTYRKIIDDRLMLPETKFKASLPMLSFINIYILSRLDFQGMSFENIQTGRKFLDSIHFWESQYTVEINARTYGWWDWPFSAYLKFEYGFIEKNWKDIVESLRVEE